MRVAALRVHAQDHRWLGTLQYHEEYLPMNNFRKSPGNGAEKASSNGFQDLKAPRS
jgi:hypothetical protein